jgi:DNA mismatch repair protein MutL
VPGWITGTTDHGRQTTERSLNPETISSYRKPDAREKSNIRNWETVFQSAAPAQKQDTQESLVTPHEDDTLLHKEVALPYQLHRRYIVSHIKSGFILIDQQAAHERILFERYIAQLAHNSKSSQRQLFPQTIELNAEDTEIMREMLEDVNALGFDIQEFGRQSFVIHSFPSDIIAGGEKRS